MIRFFALGAFLCTAAFAAQAETLPTYEKGQAFVFDNGRVEVVHGIKGDRVKWAARSGRTYVRDVNPIVPILEWSFRGQEGERRISGNPDAIWPLAAGRRVQFRAVNETRDGKGRPRRSVHLWSCSVRAKQMLKAPAGTFAAYPIVCDRFSAYSMRVVERLTWHYAPEIGHYVRREARNMGDGSRETFALYAALPPHAANSLRIETLARQATAGAATAGAATSGAR